MRERVEETASELRELAAQAEERFAGLSAQQLNWKPSAGRWSVAQCLDHLITTHSLYFPLFKKLEKGDLSPSWWERFSPLSGFFGRFLIKSLRPDNRRKLKAPAKARPSASEIDGDIVERFRRHQAELAEHVEKTPSGVDPAQTIITSPLLGLVTYSLDDTFTILVVHTQRHLAQAQRVVEAEAFPVW
ncbi:MAG TPA: DinB family protein [Acidobacteriota bacterium]|nr:DinB family protein [Acidobacteriota bacterium]